MIKPSGAWCDICETPILTGMIYRFGMPGLKNELHSCENCRHHFAKGKTLMDLPQCKMKSAILELSEKEQK